MVGSDIDAAKADVREWLSDTMHVDEERITDIILMPGNFID